MKSRLIGVLCCLLLFLLSGCGRLMTSSEVTRYAKLNFGDCNLIDEETVDDVITYTFEDKEYAFKYTVRAYMSTIDIDLASFGEVPSESSDFNKEYYKYLVSLIEPELNYDKQYVTVEFEDTSTFTETPKTLAGLAHVYSKDDKGITVAEQIGELFKKYDTRGYYSECYIPVYQDDERIGNYSLSLSSWRNADDEILDYFTELAQNYDSSAKYIRSEQKKFSELNIDRSEVAPRTDKSVDNNTIVTFYYFSTNSGEKFIADLNMKPSAEFYNNFKID